MKENDIRPEELMKKKEPALEHDKEYLRSRASSFINVNCPACNSSKTDFWAEKEGFKYEKCIHCSTIFMNPRASDSLLGEFYKQSKNYDFWNKYIFPASDSIRREKIFKPRAEKTINYCKKNGIEGGTILEIGAAFGTFCEALGSFGFFDRIIAVEPTPGLAKTCRQKGIETIEQTIEEMDIDPNSIDVIANFEVIEHIGNPHEFINKAASYLKKGGLFICSCPSGEGIGTLVLKEKAKVVDHEHVNYFNPKSLGLLLERSDIELLEVATPGELDVDLLNNSFKQSPELFDTNKFFKYLFTENNQKALSDFQVFLKNNLLSSHLWVVGQKK